jgi:undecaprenyl-diphosphatase
LLLFVGFLTLVLVRNNLSSVDYSTNSWAASIQNDSFTVIAGDISTVFDTTLMLVFSLAIAALLFFRNFKKQSLLFLAAMGGEALFVSISKAILFSPRPTNELIAETGNSYPSGHVTSGLVFFGLLVYFAWISSNSSRRKVGLIVSYLAITSIISFDRIYLNVHWFTDVLGGYLLGTFWLTFLTVLFRYWIDRKYQLSHLLRKTREMRIQNTDKR